MKNGVTEEIMLKENMSMEVVKVSSLNSSIYGTRGWGWGGGGTAPPNIRTHKYNT